MAVSGFDYTYGPKEIAGVKQLPTYAQGRFEVVTVPKEEMTGAKWLNKNSRKMKPANGGHGVVRIYL